MGKELEKSFWKRSFSTMKEMDISNLNTLNTIFICECAV
jgi:hypothetical protein